MQRTFGRLARLVLATLYLGIAIGMPLPMPADSADAGWYPCKGKGCGCSSRERCLNQCCCRKPTLPAPALSCCSLPEESDEPETCPLCEKNTKPSTSAVSKAKTPAINFVSLMEAAKCQGSAPQDVFFRTLPHVLEMPERVELAARLVFPIPLTAESVLGDDLAPPTPPPRLLFG